MAKKEKSIGEATYIMFAVTGENREPLRYFEKKLMEEAGTDRPEDIQNSRIINHAVKIAYRSRDD